MPIYLPADEVERTVMVVGLLAVLGSFVSHYIPGIGPFLTGGLDTLAAILQVIARGAIG